MLALLVLSMIFYRERAWLLDVAYQTFLMVNSHSVQIMVNRFGAGIIQLLPLSGIYLGLAIWKISFLYSISFTLFFLLQYFLIVKIFKNDALGIVLVCFLTLLVSDGFYWCISEQQQGIAVLLTFYAFLSTIKKWDRIWVWVIIFLSEVVLAYYHPLIFIPFYFLILYYWRVSLLGNQWITYVAIGMQMVFILVVKSIISANWYDNVKYNDFQTHLMDFWPNYFQIPSHLHFLTGCLTYWYWLPILLVITSFWFFKQKQWWKLGLVFSFCFGHLLLLHLVDPYSPHKFYAEVNYLPLILYPTVPFVFEILPLISGKYWFKGMLILVLVSRMYAISTTHEPYRERVKWIESQLSYAKANFPDQQLFLLDCEKIPEDILKMTWGLPYESLLISSSENKENTSSITLMKPENAIIPDSGNVILSDFREWPMEEINHHYWPILPSKYQLIICQ